MTGLPDPSAALAELARLALSAGIAANPAARACSGRLAGRSLAIETLDARFVIHFEPGAVRLDTGTDPADATLRGSPASLAATLAGREETAAVLGDTALFEDFRDSFRPRLEVPGKFVLEDLGDIVRLGVKAAESTLEGLANAVRNRRDP
ncbi:MAG: hypothetical protein OXH68_08030 [Gammaproteobacteria bacterium]|nr:hypothetical protein [Gammaproteobacteria bacterium]